MIRNLQIIVILLLFFTSKPYAQNYAVDLIPDSLKENAHCVIRNYTKELELKSPDRGTERIRKVLTVLDKEGAGKAWLYIPYNRNADADVDQVIMYDRNGKKIRKLNDVKTIQSKA